MNPSPNPAPVDHGRRHRLASPLLVAAWIVMAGCADLGAEDPSAILLPQHLYHDDAVKAVDAAIQAGGASAEGVALAMREHTVATPMHAIQIMHTIRDAPHPVAIHAEGDLSGVAAWILVSGTKGRRTMRSGATLDLRVQNFPPMEDFDAGKFLQAVTAGLVGALDPELDVNVAACVGGDPGPLIAEKAVELGLIDGVREP